MIWRVNKMQRICVILWDFFVIVHNFLSETVLPIEPPTGFNKRQFPKVKLYLNSLMGN